MKTKSGRLVMIFIRLLVSIRLWPASRTRIDFQLKVELIEWIYFSQLCLRPIIMQKIATYGMFLKL
jgi:hypothetical protein